MNESSLIVLVHSPPINLPPLLLLGLAITRGVHVRAGNGVGGAQAHGGAAHDSPQGKLVAERKGAAPGGEENVHTAPGGSHAGAVNLEAGQSEIAAEGEEGGEKGGEGLEGFEVQG